MLQLKRFMTVLMMLALLISTVSSCAETVPAETANRTTKITAHFASVEEGQELIRDRTLYHEQINEGTLAFLMHAAGERAYYVDDGLLEKSGALFEEPSEDEVDVLVD